MDHEKVADALGPCFENGDSFLRKDVVFLLSRMRNNRSLELLICALKDEDDGVRFSAAKHLGDIGDERALEPLQELCERERLSVMKNGPKTWHTIWGSKTVRQFTQEAIEKIKLRKQSLT